MGILCPPRADEAQTHEVIDSPFPTIPGTSRTLWRQDWMNLSKCLSLLNGFVSKKKWKCDKGLLVSSSGCRDNEDMWLPQTFALLFQVITSLLWQSERHILYQVAFAIHALVIFWEVSVWRLIFTSCWPGPDDKFLSASKSPESRLLLGCLEKHWYFLVLLSSNSAMTKGKWHLEEAFVPKQQVL